MLIEIFNYVVQTISTSLPHWMILHGIKRVQMFNTTKNYDLKGIKGFHKSTNILQN